MPTSASLVVALDGASEQADREQTLQADLDMLREELRVTRARLSEAEARADIDPLVDALNRRGFERELARAIAYRKRYGTPAALVYVDLDDLKPINDRCGHAAGDQILRQVAAILTANVRASDIVGRLGGDEFAVLLCSIGAPEALAKAFALEKAIEQITAAELQVRASAGTALLEQHDTPAALIARADAAMYRRKAERKAARVS